MFSKQECNSQRNSSDDSHENKQADDTLKTSPQDDTIVRNDTSEIVDPQCTTNSSIIEKELYLYFIFMHNVVAL